MKKIITLGIVLFAFLPFRAGAQFVLNGNASVTSPECSDSTTTYMLTPDLNTQAGEIWYNTQVSLTNRFDIQFEIYLGTKAYTSGADGICFVFQQQSVNAGSSGGGMGYGGITPSLAVEFDTFKNSWDPNYCHTAIEKNGDVQHTDLSGNNLAGPVQLDPANPNLPDGNWHHMEVIWDPGLQTLSVYYDCIFRLSYTGNIVTDIFGGNPNVYWGFTAGTGGSDNKQEVCVGSSYLNNLRDTTLCAGGSDTLKAKGGASYTWSPAAGLNIDTGGTVIATPTVTTTYTVSIKNGCGVITTDSARIVVNPVPTMTSGPVTNISCYGASTGSASVSASGGTGPYTFAWSPSGGSNASASNLTAGTYTVTMTDINGCNNTTGSLSFTLTQPPAFRDTISSFSNVVCNAGNASATVSATGGNGAYTYLWSPGGATNATETGLAPGTYTITVTDGNNCTAVPTLTLSVKPPESLSTYIESRVIVQCEEYGYITTHAATGGVPPYNYSWAPSGGTNLTTVTTLTAGSYTVTVTDNNGCTATASESISYPPRLLATANLTSGTTCYDGNNGSASVTATGGTMPYTYSWFPSGGTKATASGLSAGAYTVTVTDSAGCQYPVTLTVTEPAQMIITTDTVNVMSTNSCNGQASVTVVSGGTPPYTYAWSPGGQTTATITGLCQGDYCCTITQANGCSQDVCLIVLNTTGIDNLSSGSGQISIYPNPNNGIFTIQSSVDNSKSSVEIYNVLGQNIYTATMPQTAKGASIEINLHDRSAGIYFYRVITGEGNLIGEGKVVIEK